MTLQILRDTASLSSVWADYIEILGVRDVAGMVGKSASTIYASANPDEDYLLDRSDLFVKLDRACLQAKNRAPYRAWFDRQMGAVGAEAVEELSRACLNVGATLGALQGKASEALSPTSPGGERVTAHEGREIKQMTKRLRGECDDIDLAVDALSGGGPRVVSGGQ